MPNKEVTFSFEETRPGDPPEGIFTLRFDPNALCDAEEKSGRNLLQCVAAFGLRLAVLDVRAILYGLLLPSFPTVTLKEAGEVLGRDFTTVFKAMQEALGEEHVRGIVKEAAAMLYAEMNEVFAALQGIVETKPAATGGVEGQNAA